MALKKCKECGNEVSTEAVSCPKCGAVVNKKTGCLGYIGVTFLILLAIGAIGSVIKEQTPREPVKPPSAAKQPATSVPTTQPPQQKVATIDKSEQKQRERKKLIEKLINEEIFQKVEVPGNLPRVWVRPAFFALDFDTKAKFISVVYAYYFDGTNEIDGVRIFDALSNKEIGAYAAVYHGLKLY